MCTVLSEYMKYTKIPVLKLPFSMCIPYSTYLGGDCMQSMSSLHCSDTCPRSSRVEQTHWHIIIIYWSHVKKCTVQDCILTWVHTVIMSLLALPMLVQIQSTGRPAQCNPGIVVRKSSNLDFPIALVANTFEAFILPRAPTLFSTALSSGSGQCSKNGCRRTWPKFHSSRKQRKRFE